MRMGRPCTRAIPNDYFTLDLLFDPYLFCQIINYCIYENTYVCSRVVLFYDELWSTKIGRSQSRGQIAKPTKIPIQNHQYRRSNLQRVAQSRVL